MTIPKNDRYRAVQEEDDSWTVVDRATELAVLLSNEPMVLLHERFATTLATFLNLEDEMGGKITLQ
jgi:hypothetical protein